MEEIFRAARDRDYSNLHLFCHPGKMADGDCEQYICSVGDGDEDAKAEFVAYFEKAYINGETIINESPNGMDVAEVSFWFNHPGGESRSNETMIMGKIDGKWYLVSF